MLEEILNKFDLEGELIDFETIGSGNINNTYVAKYKFGRKAKKYLVQKINTRVFTAPYKLMKNIRNKNNKIY